jgi:hypothetical protein
MMGNMLSRLKVVLVAAVLLAGPAIARADDSGNPPIDARFQGYGSNVAPQPGAVATQWLVLIGLGVVSMGVMFINSRRSHLD